MTKLPYLTPSAYADRNGTNREFVRNCIKSNRFQESDLAELADGRVVINVAAKVPEKKRKEK